MTAAELRRYLKPGILTVAGLRVPVQVLDAKRAYGNLRLLVTPDHAINSRINDKGRPALKGRTGGDDLGAVWVDAGRVEQGQSNG